MDDNTEDPQPDSPAVPGRSDTLPVSRSSAPSSGGHITHQVQVEETEDQDSIEGARENVDEPGTTDRSIIDALKECIPAGSNSVLERVIYNRSPSAMVKLKSDGGSMNPDEWDPEAVWDHVDELEPSEHAILVIDDIDDEWCEALCRRYPKAISKMFLLEHILGLDAAARWLQFSSQGLEEELQRSIAADLKRIDRIFPHLRQSQRREFGGHIDCWLAPALPAPYSHKIHGCRLSLGASSHVKVNRFLSYCQLQENFYVILTTSFDRFQKGDPRDIDEKTLIVSLRAGKGVEFPVMWWNDSMFNSTFKAFGACWPFFTWKVRASEGDVKNKKKLINGFLLIAWIVATSLKPQFETAEERMRSLAYLSIKNDQERFTQLVDFRRDVGNRYDELKRSQYLVKAFLEYSTEKDILRRGGFVLDGGLDLQRREDLKKPLRSLLAELEKKLDAIKEDLNEELQVTIGTVQVRDAQLMREQTAVTARQTKWTVALTVLAAVYLPMTLVTGIFGMNITEISSEATAPNARWVVGAWMVVASLTVAGILSYVAIDKRRARKKKSDLEANDEEENSSVKGKAEAGKRIVETSKNWSRGLKQKAKMVSTRKQE